jgi:peptidoglycan-N-acetylglucosamine deacetylase
MPLITYDNGDRNINKIALNFDDGPNPYWTEKVLDILKDQGVKANFFVLGKYAEKYGRIIKRSFDEGHLIGNHTYSHPKLEEGHERGDFEVAEEIIYKIIGEHTKFIRPPYNHTGLCADYAPAVKGEIKIINNDVIPHDWQENAENILRVVMEKTQNGSIILLHDGSHREEQLETRPTEMFKVLPAIIKELKNKGFEFARLDEMDI